MSEVDKFLDSYESNKNGGQKLASTSVKPASEVDALMQTAPPQDKGFLGHARDLGLSAVKSAIAVPEAVVGLADIPTGGRVGKFLENEGGSFGFRPKEAKEILGEFHTEAYKDQQSQFQQADGVLDKTAVAIQNPSLIANAVTESVAPMLAGGVAARGLMAGTRLGRAGAIAAERGATAAQQAQAAGRAAAAAGAIGEGTMMAGSQAEAIRQETEDGLLTPTQAGAAVATGLAGTLFGYLGGRVAQRFGFGDIDTMIARGTNPQGVASEIASLPAKSIPRQVIEGAISEGFLEELPQSISEQIIQNLALGKDWSEGVEDAAVMGTLAGMAMGGGASLYSGMTRPEPQDGGLPPPAAANEQPAPPPRGFAPATERPVIDEAALGRAGVYPPAPAPIINERALEPAAPTPSQQMGLDPAAGPMSAAAALAVDSGASPVTPAATQAASPTLAQAVDQKPAGGIADQLEAAVRSGITGDALQAQISGVMRDADAADVLTALKDRPDLDSIAQIGLSEPAWNMLRSDLLDARGVAPEDRSIYELGDEPVAVKTENDWRFADMLDRLAEDEGWLTGADAERALGFTEEDESDAIESAEGNAGLVEGDVAGRAQASAPATAPSTPAQAAGEGQEELGQFDVSGRTPEQLQHLASNGQAGWKEAAQAELQRRAAPPTAAQPTQVSAAPEQSRPAPNPRSESAQQSEATPPAASAEGWDGMTAEQRAAVLTKPGGWSTAKGGLNVIGKKLAGQNWTKINPATRATIERLMQGEQTSNVPTAQQVDGEAQDARGQEGEAAGEGAGIGAVAAQPASAKFDSQSGTTRTQAERELWEKGAESERAESDVGVTAGTQVRFVPLADAVATVREAEQAGVEMTPFQVHQATGIRVGDAERVIREAQAPAGRTDAAMAARPQPGDDGYTLELAREDLAALRAEIKKQGEDGRPVDSRLNDRVRNFEKLVASMESAQKREQPAQASDDDIDAMFDDALAEAVGEQQPTGEIHPRIAAILDDGPNGLLDKVGQSAIKFALVWRDAYTDAALALESQRDNTLSEREIEALYNRAFDNEFVAREAAAYQARHAKKDEPEAPAVTAKPPANQEVMAESLEDELRAQKKRVQRLRGGDATKLKAAEARLRAMRQSIFDAEDKWVPAARNGDQEALTKLEEAGFADTADAIRAFAPAAPRTAGKALKSAAKNAASALDDAINGLGKLFGGSGRLSSGLTFDEETYAKAKPLFIAAAANIRAASRDLRDVMKAVVDMVVERFGADTAKNMKPYVTQFVKDVRDGKVQLEQEQKGNEPAADGAQDQGRAEAVRGGRGSDPQQDPAPADSGNMAPRQPEDGRPAGEAGDSGRSGVRVPGADVARGEGEPQGRASGDGRARAGGAGSPDAGAGGAGRDGDLGGVSSPAATSAQAQDLHIDNPLEIVGGSPVQRFNRNRAALELLQTLTEEGRQSTPDEQKVLAGYIGWGSFGQELFQGSWERPAYKDEGIWKERGQWLRDTLGESAWKSAQRSITNAHYTDPPTVLAMWDMVRRMGFEGGKVLEPSMGTGNFFSMMPADLRARSQLTGIELDETTGAIAKQLFPRSNVRIMGYQDSKTPDGFYDLIIGNWPFENTPVADRRYNKLNPMLHDYFFLKTMDQVRPGGIVIGITSAGSMDKQNTAIRRELAKQAELVAAIRLPSGAFEEYAGTKVVTDIVVLRKRPQRLVATPSDATWVETGDYKTPAGETIKVNRYYLDNPQNIIGTLDFGSGTTTFRAGMIVRRPENMAEQLQKAIELVPQGAMLPRGKVDHLTYYANETGERHGALALVNDRLMIAVGDQLVEANEASKYVLKDAKKTAVREQQLRAAIDLRKKHAALVDAERGGRPADDARKALRGAYDAFVKAHGGLRDSFALKYLERINDPFFAEIAALENDDGTPAAVMERSTTRGRRALKNPSVRDAYVLARNQSVNPSVAEVARLAGKPEQAVKAELLDSGAVFEAPNGDVVPSDIYLSGNVRQKLREAQAALDEGNTAMRANVAALKEVMPEDVPYFNIETQFGATWVPNEVYAQYIAHMLGRSGPKGVEVSFRAGRWKVKMEPGLSRIPEAAANYGTPGYPFSRLVQAAISNQVLRLTSKDENGKDVYDAARTEEANARIAKIREDFGAWLWSDPERRQDLEREYNEARNAWATPTYDGSFLTFEGMALTLGNGAFQLRQHQVNAIWRAIVNRRSINAHEVGTGKTFTMGGIAVESRRYGIAKKPMLLAHNANSATVAAEIRMMYPSARVLYVDNLQGDKKEIRLRQIANDDWDVIVVPHSLISSLALREETMMRMAEDDIKALEAEFFDAARDDNINHDLIDLDDNEDIAKIRSVTAKELAKARKRIIENIKKQAQKSSKEGAIAFEDLGVDMILVDEVHEFKKPPIVTRMKMKGLNTKISNRSIALQFMTRYVRQMNNGGNVHTFTGTPITNTITEIYHQMRYVMEAEMEQATIADWDGWFGSFAAEVQDVELTAAGDYEMVSRLAGFVNVPELRAMVGQYMDTVFATDMPEMRPRKINGKELSDHALTEAERADLLNGRTEGAEDRPYKKVINDSADMTAEQMRIFTRLQQYAREWRAATGKQKKEWMRAGDPRSPIITEGITNKASFDARLLDDEGFAGQEGMVPDEPASKASRVVKNVLEIYNSHPQANQVIFSETGFGKRATRSAGSIDGEKQTVTLPVFSTMHDIVERLVQGGIPREQIAIVDGSTSKERRKEIAEAMNASTIRVVIGSTDTLGVGVNMQRNLRAMHHVDAPYMPGELEQRNGRGMRQRNQWNTVLEYRYMTDRLDGKRWQILAVKQRFINAFMKAAAGTRVIEGEAAADEQSDILESFSEAAGDPRILQRVKMQKKLETLHRKERMYTQGIADMRRQERSSAELADRLTRELKQLADSRTQANIEALIAGQQQAFAATIDGTTYNTRKDAADALQAFIEANVRIGDGMKTVGEYAGHPLRIEWPRHMDAPVTQIDAFGQEFAGKGIAGAEAKMRNFPSVIENKTKRRDMERSTAENMRAAMNQPFAQAADLERITKQLQDLEKDLEINPVPPPAWLRQGAPIDSEVHRNKRPYIVAGHRYSKDGWFVIAEDDKGTVLIPYMEATDEVGMPMYEEREFVPPVVIEKEKEGAAPADAPADVVVDRSAQSATTNPLRNADGTFARQAPAGDSMAFSARPAGALLTGITEKGLVRAMRLQFNGLAEITGKLLERGRAGKRGGVIVIGTADNAEIGRIVAERTGRKLDSTVRKFSSAGRINGFYDPKTGLTFLVGPNLNPITATAVMLHEMMHGQQRQDIDRRALDMIDSRAKVKDPALRGFLDRVMTRMRMAGEVGNASEASAYIVEQAAIEGRSAGYTLADNAFMQWVDAKIGKRVGDFLRSFASMVRSWMFRRGIGVSAMTVDDFVGYAMAGLERAVAGEVRGRAKGGRMASMSDRSRVASEQAPNPAGDGTTGGDLPPIPSGHERFFHMGRADNPLTEISGGVESGNVFGGVFAVTGGAKPAYGDGKTAYFMDVPHEKILTQQALNYHIPYEDQVAALKHAMPWLGGEDVELAYTAVIEDKANDGSIDVDDLTRVFREDDAGSAGWEAQRIRGKVASALGYQAVEMSDENGTSYLILPGVKVSPVNELSAPSASGAAFSLFSRSVGDAPAQEEQRVQSEAFRRWFGDSKVVDASGQPLVVYHGTDANITEFKVSERGTYGGGIYLTPDTKGASDYAIYRGQQSPAVYPLYASIKNPATGAEAARIASWRGEENARAELIARGYDGVIDMRSGEIVAFYPEQIKSATGNNGDFDPDNDDIRFSRSGLESAQQAAKNIGAGLKAITIQDVKKAGKHKLTDWLKLGLQFLGRRQLTDIYGDVLPLADYDRLAAQMEADKNDVGAAADELARRWGKLPDEGKLADLMHDATLAQIDADSAVEYVPGDDLAKSRALKAQFGQLSAEAQKVYREARDHYRKHHAEVRQAIIDRIMRSELREERRAELLKRMDADFFKAIKGVYFPLARFGQYVVVTKDNAGKVASVSRAETMAEAEAMRAEMVKAFPARGGYHVGRVILSKEFVAGRDMVGRGFMTELYEALDEQGLDPSVQAELEDTLGQLYLSSLPDLSWAKHGIHRKGTPGFSSDARRAFAQNTFHGARYLAKLKYGDQMQAELDRMQKHVDEMAPIEGFDQPAAQRVVDEMNKRHEATMNPKGNPLSTALTSFGFVYYLGISPAAAMVNMSQTPLVAYPVMGAKWGFRKAGAALMAASAEVMEGKNDLRAVLAARLKNEQDPKALRKHQDEIAAYDEAVRTGVIDVTMAHDLAGIAQGEDAKVMWKIRPVMRLSSYLFHNAERFNRQATFLAAYRLARDAGAKHDAAYSQAVKATYDGHFDYSAGNRPRVMQGNVARVVLLFKQYAQNMIYTIARNAYQSVKGESPEVRREARKVFGALMTTHAAAAGVLGLPMVGTLLALASALGGSDDEPWDAEVALRNMLADAFGPGVSEVIAKGFSRLTPWDISGRVGLDKLLLPDVNESLEGQRWAEAFATAMLGPVIGMGVNAAKGAQKMVDGDYARGLEDMLPIFARNPIKAYRQYSEGEVDRTGVVIKDEVSLAGVLGQASGFSPSEIRLAFEGRSAVMSADRRLAERRQDLMTQFARAAMGQDQDGMTDARAAIAEFNKVNPGRRITPPQMWQSVRNRERRIREAEDGVYLPRTRRDVLDAGRFAEAV